MRIHLEILIKQFLGPTLRVSDSVGLGQSWRFSFLTHPQVLLMLLGQGPQFENQGLIKHIVWRQLCLRESVDAGGPCRHKPLG